MTKQATIQDVLEAVHGLATHMDERFIQVEEKIAIQGKELRVEMADLGKELRSEMAAQGKELRAEMSLQGKELREEIRSGNQELRSEIGLSQKTSEVGITALNSRFGRMETFMTKVAKKLDMDFQAS